MGTVEGKRSKGGGWVLFEICIKIEKETEQWYKIKRRPIIAIKIVRYFSLQSHAKTLL